MEFDIPKDQSSIIKVIGVGGGGGNAVNHMYGQGIKGVDFIVCNTDRQALDISPVPLKIQLGPSLTEGRGAGSIPEIGMNAVTENIDEIRDLLSKNAKMVFVTAGMGGGTGTGAAPVIARIAKEMGILTVGIVTVPFSFEGKKRRMQAEEGLQNMRDNVDTLLVINNERLREISGNLTLGNAFAQADDVLTTAAKGIAEVISVTGAINVDFNDVNTVMKDSGVAIMGSAIAEGENRAIKAVQDALSSPLLNDNNIAGAKYVLLNITYGDQEVLMDEISDITDYIQDEAGSTADVIWGHGYDDTLGDALSVTLIATGFNQSPITGFEKAPEKKVNMLEEQVKKEVTAPLNSPVKNTFTPPSQPDEKTENEPFLKALDKPQQSSIEDNVSETTTSFNWEINTVEQKEEEEVIATNDELETEEVTEAVENTPVTSEENKVKESEDAPVKRYFLDDEVEQDVRNEVKENSVKLTPEDQQKRAQERLERIQKFTSKIKSAEGLSELEKQPAFVRRNIELEETPHSSENRISRLEVGKREDKSDNSLRSTNSFLHDNVD
ncbi:MAG: cell division protein FtsZ [Crocinitomicaceae bacterium]|nr:cell division protein FtsZ [Crocinitomicaceae bacterium]